jgi:hypothetical protein
MAPKHLLIAFLATFAGVAWGGTPIKVNKICPVGGEEFTVTGTASCTTMGRTMSFRPYTSCDFITRLPVCPSNGLPMYQEFTQDQIVKLTSLIATPDYAALRELPPWQRAYGIANYLGQAGSSAAFGILLSAMWFETVPFFESKSTLDQFLAEAELELERAPEANKPIFNAILAYALASAGRIKESDERLDQARQAPDISEYLQAYISAIEVCQEDMSLPACQPDARIPR